MNENENEKTFSVLLTVQRTTIEYGFVSVLITTDLVGEDGQIDTEKLLACAAESAAQNKMTWYADEQTVDISPTQRPRDQEEYLNVNPQCSNLDDAIH